MIPASRKGVGTADGFKRAGGGYVWVLCLLLLSGCGGGGGGGAPAAIPDLSGYWAGSWQGNDPALGIVTGTWEAELAQDHANVSGNATLLGDVDCMDGAVAGASSGNSVIGTVNRTPCNLNHWTLTSVDPASYTASGTWTQDSSNAQGTFAGARIALAGGPRILAFSPRGGGANTLVTIVGRGFGAIRADGATLYVSDNRDGGDVSVIDLASRSVTHRITTAAGFMPLGLAVHPAGGVLYVNIADTSGAGLDVLRMLDTATWAAVDVSLTTPGRPTGIAVRPDGGMLYVAQQTGNALSYYDTVSGTASAVGGLAAPTGVAVSPDGRRVFVTNRGSDNVSVLYASSNGVDTTISVGSAPVGIAISPDGSHAYTANSTHRTLSDIGGNYTLTVALSGNGYGTVVSTPAGIDCGTACQTKLPAGTGVQLTANATGQSSFSGWQGDADCQDGNITLNGNKTCIAVFSTTANPPAVGPGGCFIATAAYGTPLAEEVTALRGFRDRHLLTNAPGRFLVDAYYAASPPIATFIARHEWARAATRFALWPLVALVRHPEAALGLILAAAGLTLAGRRRSAAAKTAP